MNVQDRSDVAASGALIAGLRNSTVFKYLVFVGKPNTVSYPELIDEICHHINVEKAFNLEASKLSQDTFLGGGKMKVNSQVGTSKQNGDDNGKKSKYEESETQNSRGDNDRGRPQQTRIPWFKEYIPLIETINTSKENKLANTQVKFNSVGDNMVNIIHSGDDVHSTIYSCNFI